ncbi:hypothetical protein Hanom_Chr07g00586411 [Helianthus anomalus]
MVRHYRRALSPPPSMLPSLCRPFSLSLSLSSILSAPISVSG